MAKLWDRMIEMYGHKFTSSFGEQPNDTWARALSDMTGHEIATGLHACFEREDNWPPTLPEFITMCRPAKEQHLEEFLGLPKPRANKEYAQDKLKAIRDKLR